MNERGRTRIKLVEVIEWDMLIKEEIKSKISIELNNSNQSVGIKALLLLLVY